MKSICVFCGSSPGSDKEFAEETKKLAELFLKENIELVYGGGNIGLMGVIAGTMMEGGGKVTGIMPEFLMRREHADLEITKLILVQSMHERKAMMSELSNAFIILPGGIGTLEEFFEVWTWEQLRLHNKPIGVLNISGYYDDMIKFLDNSVEKSFLRKADRDLILIDDDPTKLLIKMQARYTENHTDPNIEEKT